MRLPLLPNTPLVLRFNFGWIRKRCAREAENWVLKIEHIHEGYKAAVLRMISILPWRHGIADCDPGRYIHLCLRHKFTSD